MPERDAHLVGSLPGATPAEAMRTALEILGPRLASLPADMDSHPAFLEARAAAGRADLMFQHSVPSDLTRAVAGLGLTGALRSRRRFTEATLNEIRDVSATAGPDTLFQIEVPTEVALIAKLPPQIRPAMANVLARPTVGLATRSAPGTRFAVHLCLGEMNDRAFGTLSDVNPLVLLSNAIVAGWPAGQPLDLVHAPFAAADQPTTTDPAFYGPLSNLRVPPGTRFSAGFAHVSRSVGDQRTVRGIIEDHLGSEVVVSAGCGLGRRTPEDARALLERMAELCEF